MDSNSGKLQLCLEIYQPMALFLLQTVPCACLGPQLSLVQSEPLGLSLVTGSILKLPADAEVPPGLRISYLGGMEAYEPFSFIENIFNGLLTLRWGPQTPHLNERNRSCLMGAADKCHLECGGSDKRCMRGERLGELL